MSAVDALRERVSREVDSGYLPSAQIAVARHGELITFDTFGDPEVKQPRFVLQSVGRTVAASVAWKLLGDGLLRLDERVADVIPEFGANGKDVVTVEHALTHTGGFPFAPLGYPKMLDRATRLASFGKWRLDTVPGEVLQYHLTSVAWLIAEFVERRDGRTMPAYLQEEIVAPLGLTFGLAVPPAEQRATVAPMRCTDGDGSEVDPWGPWYLNDPAVVAAGEPSHAVVGTAADVALHYQALLAALDGDDRIWAPTAVADAVRPHVVGVPAGDQLYGGGTVDTAMGLFVLVRGAGTPNLPSTGSPETFGNSGAAYQAAFADPRSGLSFALLSNGYPKAGYDYSPRGRALLDDAVNLAALL
ncbi:serine hydrolase domain-containing protein [Cryptosporangium sp. NPDC051539]|uniref:serine hydrolase domain-containing protein n=1 Tax=Cryptosporangium sp. NPDC051539 TaxID=3363962 RepID=UPI003792D302